MQTCLQLGQLFSRDTELDYEQSSNTGQMIEPSQFRELSDSVCGVNVELKLTPRAQLHRSMKHLPANGMVSHPQTG